MITLHQAIESYMLAQRAEGKAQRTLQTYAARLYKFMECVGNPELTSLDTERMRQYMAALHERTERYPGQKRHRAGKLSTHTVWGHDKMLRVFFRWCVREGYLERDPMDRIKKPKRDEVKPKAMEVDDLVKMLAVCDDSKMGQRDRALLMFFTDTGCRVGGLIQLQNGDLDLAQRRAVVHEKGGRARYVYLVEPSIAALQCWLDVRPGKAMTIFCALNSRSFGRPLTTQGVYQILKRIAKTAGVQGVCNPHSLRHMFAIQNIEAGNDLLTVSQLMGHTDLKTTEHYMKWTDKQRGKRHDQYSPIHILMKHMEGHEI